MRPDRGWALVPNPGWAGQAPGRLAAAACHDRSHFVTVKCQCGMEMHLHETQWRRAAGQAIGARCHGCGEVLRFEPGFFDQALAEMRTQGWIE